MELDRLYKLRMEFLEAQREQCVCVSNITFEHRCWGCRRCWHCVDKASDHHCIECCNDDFVAAKAAWELRMWPSIEGLLKLPNGHYGALILVCHQAEVAYKVMNPSAQDNVIHSAIRCVLIKSGLVYDNDYSHKLAEKVRVILNMLKHDRRTGEKEIPNSQADDVLESLRIASRSHFGFHSSLESAPIINGERQPPTERKSELGLFSIVCKLCQGLDTMFSGCQLHDD